MKTNSFGSTAVMPYQSTLLNHGTILYFGVKSEYPAVQSKSPEKLGSVFSRA